MRLGIFGGTFDPVHYGHLLLAEWCREARRLDRVWFVPTAAAPHKLDNRTAAADERIEMLELATSGHTAFAVSKIEAERGGVSYTVDTLEAIHQAQPQDELFFLLGSDSLHDLPSWREPARICQLATLVTVHRAGAAVPDFECLASVVSPARLSEIKQHLVDMPQIDLASREIRRRVAEGLSIRYQTPRAVERYIETHGLYRD